MHSTWPHLWTSILAAFLASLVECVEALTVVLAVGSLRGWRSALAGVATATLVLALIVLALGSSLTRIPLHLLQLGIGTLLVLFGLRWLRKAILRAAGLIPLHDEAAAFAKNTAVLATVPRAADKLDKIAFATSFNITMLEGTEVIFIVIAIGAGGTGMMLAASLGALAALIVVTALGLIVHRPLARVPENTLKFIVGVLLSAFGTFWVGEGMNLNWPASDWSLPAIAAAYTFTAVAAVSICRRVSAPPQPLPDGNRRWPG